MEDPAPGLADIREARELLADRVLETPVWRWHGKGSEDYFGPETHVFLKLELFQLSGTFKARGAFMNILGLDREQLARGVTAVSAGNHAVAVAYAARKMGTAAKVVMLSTAKAVRVQAARAYGAEVVLVEGGGEAFEEARRIEREERRALIHPFDGRDTVLGTATLGLELSAQVPDLEAMIVPIGGGGLCAGVATAIKLTQPRCRVIGVEPEGADTMHRSFAAGRPESIDRIHTIADSLGAPHAAPYSFSLCRRHVDELVLVRDDEILRAMALLLKDLGLVVEPAGAAATAALCGPFREALRGKRVGVVVSGSNIDSATFFQQILKGPQDVAPPGQTSSASAQRSNQIRQRADDRVSPDR